MTGKQQISHYNRDLKSIFSQHLAIEDVRNAKLAANKSRVGLRNKIKHTCQDSIPCKVLSELITTDYEEWLSWCAMENRMENFNG